MEVTRLLPQQADEAVDVLCDAFDDYPLMRFVIGPVGDAYGRHLRTLIGFFAAARFLKNDVVIGVSTSVDELVAVATVKLPGERDAPAVLRERQEEVWRELGAEARSRYRAYRDVCRKFVIEPPHYHLGMIGVRRSHTGRGLARRLLDTLHEGCDSDPGSCGVALNTQHPNEVPFYQHFGYRIIGQAPVLDNLQIWCMFKDDGESLRHPSPPGAS